MQNTMVNSKQADAKNAYEEEVKRDMEKLCRRIRARTVIPIISNEVVYEQLFARQQLADLVRQKQLQKMNDRENGTKSQVIDPLGDSIEDILAQAWAIDLDFPLPEKYMLPRVALYDRFKYSEDDPESNQHFLDWLKRTVLELAEKGLPTENISAGDKDDKANRIEDLKADLKRDPALSYIVKELDYSGSCPGENNPLKHLAKLHLPVYITTSPFDFMEEAIRSEGRDKVKTQYWHWSKEPIISAKGQDLNMEILPTEAEPVVFHLFGIESKPATMVLNEDHYLDFMSQIVIDEKRVKRQVPTYLRSNVTSCSLLLLGYRLRDWEFRVMLKGLLKSKGEMGRWNLAIQLDPGKQCAQEDDAERVRSYLEGYFGKHQFNIQWDTTSEFTDRLCEEWDRWK
jgi:hypothetical protein